MQRCSDLLLIRHIQIIIVVRAIYTPVYLSIYIHIHIPVCVCTYIFFLYICTSDWQTSKLSDTDKRSGEIGTIILLCKAH